MDIKLLLLTFGTVISTPLLAQNFYTEVLEVNNLKMAVSSNGDMHRNSALTSALTEVPIGSGKTCIFAQSLWIGGWDDNMELRLAANTYNQNGNDFHPGPIADSYNSTYDSTYDKVWKITRQEIEHHQTYYNTNSYVIPEVISSWPANGNTANGEAQNLAPYFDQNNNSIYEPELGDHPIIRGDEALYIIYNDSKYNHSSSFGEIIEAEIHLMLYAYSNSGIESNDNVVFSHYEIYNRSDTNTFPFFHISNWLDFDIGEGFDDYIGTNTNYNLIYAYNGDPIDSEYGDNSPAYGHMLLNETLDKSMFYNNTTSFDDGNPNVHVDYLNYMQGNWKGGNVLINPIDSSFSDYAFPGESDTTLYPNWSEITQGNLPSDRRMLGSKKIENFAPGDKICLDYASIFAQDNSLNNIDILDRLFDIAGDVKVFYDTQYDDCEDLSDLNISEINLLSENSISFTQSKNNISIELAESIDDDIKIQIINILGQVVDNQTLYKGDKIIEIQIPDSSKGIYIINLEAHNIDKNLKMIIH